MDTKELNNLIDRISLTGPEGIKKIKKVLKELSDGSGGGSPSSGSMGEDEEYTIAQALNDLNARIEGLQSQVEQQDYIRINTEQYFPEVGLDELPAETMTREFWNVIENIRKRGSLLNVVLCDGFGNESKIIGYVFSEEFNECYEINYAIQAVMRLQRPE